MIKTRQPRQAPKYTKVMTTQYFWNKDCFWSKCLTRSPVAQVCCLVPECGHLKRQLGLIQRYNAGEIPISGPVVHCCKVCTVAISGILHQAVATARHYLASLSFLVLSASVVLVLSFLLVLFYCTLTRYKDSIAGSWQERFISFVWFRYAQFRQRSGVFHWNQTKQEADLDLFKHRLGGYIKQAALM